MMSSEHFLEFIIGVQICNPSYYPVITNPDIAAMSGNFCVLLYFVTEVIRYTWCRRFTLYYSNAQDSSKRL